jgi:hypothetical protein
MPQNRRSKRRPAIRRRNAKLPIGLVVAGLVVAVLLAALAFTLTSGGGDVPTAVDTAAEPTRGTSAANGPRLDVDRTVHDEGSVPYEHEVSASFRVTNTGSQALTLGRPTVKTLEGC